jgi:hypothetical protein
MTQDQIRISTQSEEINPQPESETVFCTYHPDQPTVLRCNRCGTPICYRCAIRTPVGFRCRECVRSQQAVYFNAHASDSLVAAVVAFVVAAVAGALAYVLLGILGLLFGVILAIFAGPVAGGVIAEAIRASVGRRRSRNLKWIAAAASVVGILLIALVLAFSGAPLFLALLRLPVILIGHLYMLVFAVAAASTIYARLQ